MKLYLIRHAQTVCNAQGITFDNLFEAELTDVGKKQSAILDSKLNQVNLDKIFVSESKRTLATIKPLLHRLNATAIADRNLNEADFGIFKNLTLEEVRHKFEDIYQARLNDKFYYRLPEGESYLDVSQRLETFINKLIHTSFNQCANYLIVTHATVLKVFLIKYLGYAVKQADEEFFHNTAITIVEYANNTFTPIMINDIAV